MLLLRLTSVKMNGGEKVVRRTAENTLKVSKIELRYVWRPFFAVRTVFVRPAKG